MIKFWFSKFFFVVAAALTLSEVSLANTVTSAEEARSWRFTVWLDETPIGYHQVSIEKENDKKTVHTQADFDVRLLFIPVYSYEHETRERWENNCLVDIASTTNDNGDEYFIDSTQHQNQLAIQTKNGRTALQGCVRSFAYWDIELLNSERLLNTQTGEYQPVSVTDMGTGLLPVEEDRIEARHFRLVVEGMTIDLWYTDEMRWLALQSVTESGAVLRYLPENFSNIAEET
ncbi:MAG: hypothetical protein HKP12_13260 [Gammaproteobacteria bacterium]|nr:hypothetical protein [Gammaproteobacteria bacterium]